MNGTTVLAAGGSDGDGNGSLRDGSGARHDRCVDRMKTGFFWTSYFECEPGTVFSDDLDQCVFPHMVRPPCGTYYPSTTTTHPTTASTITPAPPPTTPSTTTTTTTTPAPPPTTPSTTTTTTTTTTPAPPPTTPSTTTTTTTTTPQPHREQLNTTVSPFTHLSCRFSEEFCYQQPPCPPDTVTRTLCRGCYIGNTFIPASVVCNAEGHLFEPETNACILDPAKNINCILGPPSTALQLPLHPDLQQLPHPELQQLPHLELQQLPHLELQQLPHLELQQLPHLDLQLPHPELQNYHT
nr:integumentary mucin C.1-like [Cherax quadricarinatus]